jgi:hypothetical protein
VAVGLGLGVGGTAVGEWVAAAVGIVPDVVGVEEEAFVCDRPVSASAIPQCNAGLRTTTTLIPPTTRVPMMATATRLEKSDDLFPM